MPAHRKKILKKVIDGRLTKAKAAVLLGVSRKTIYVWLSQLGNIVESSRRLKKNDRAVIKRRILHVVSKHPEFGPAKIRNILEKAGYSVSTSIIWKILKEECLNEAINREEFAGKYRNLFSLRNKSLPGQLRLNSTYRKRMIEEVLEEGASVKEIVAKYKISRKTYAKWKRRYQNASEAGRHLLDSLKDQHPKASFHPKGASIRVVNSVLELVARQPELSSHKIAEKLGVIGNHGVQNILKRHNLSHSHMRINYALSENKALDKTKAFVPFVDRVKSVFDQFTPNTAPAPPPATKSIIKYFIASFVSSFMIFGFFSYLANITYDQSVGYSVGLVFAFTSLVFGMMFFIYSLKYYLTLAIVLSYSQSSDEEKRGSNLFSWILGEAKNKVESQNGVKSIGLEANLDHVKLKRLPYISVQIPFFNEKYVAERAIAAACNFDYKGDYEVFVCDDSTDETTQIIQDYILNSSRKNVASSKGKDKAIYQPHTTKGDGWTLTSVEVRPGVTLKHLHRTTRSGFKGGALKLALTLVDPRCEFISIFDADFVPYPDSLDLFLKYFQEEAGTLDFRSQRSEIRDQKSESGSPKSDIRHPKSESNIAAVQGYQWHVLNKSENWITRGVRSEYAGSYIIERSGQEIYGGLKHISGSVYMIRRDVLEEVGWETSITEDYELTLKLYEKGYRVVYTPYIQAPAECVSTLKRLIRQRMRWAEGHSYNVKVMWKRLLFGHWSDRNDQLSINNYQSKSNLKISQLDNSLKTGKWKLKIRSNNTNSNKVFIPSPLTFSEKIEFLFNIPYYLQAFFFLIGTFSWLISETVFQVRLPFWTVLWGWSLVLTNMFALPLVNAVGLFLEESEEKDYAGLASFVALSYIVVPFQAYAALKGFIEKEEGGWFRTPKTGRITDVLSRGTFYRFISSILPRKDEEASVSLEKSYLAMASANNIFDEFYVSRKTKRWVGKIALTSFMTITILLMTYAPYIPVNNSKFNPQFNSGTILSPEKNSKQSFFTFVKEVYAKENPLDASFEINTKGLELTGETKDFVLNQSPTFNVRVKNSVGDRVKINWNKLTHKNTSNKKIISAKIIDSEGQILQGLNINKSGNTQLFLNIDTTTDIKPGTYSLVVEDNFGNGLIQDFTWGVLAINTNKSTYRVGDISQIAIGVLDEDGRVVCDADLTLNIVSPSGHEEIKQTHDGTITVNDACLNKGFTEIPDYETSFEVRETGIYEMYLSARTDKGEYNISDSFISEDNPDFDIERFAPTRIYPLVNYPVRISITPSKDYSGIVEETIPASFELIEVSGTDEIQTDFDEKLNVQVKGISVDLEVIQSGDKKKIRWFVDWKAGETYHLTYLFDAPNVSPEYYTLGPLWIDGFTESRVWQIASDATARMILLWDNFSSLPTTADGSWTCLSCGSGDFYQKFIRGAADYNATGGGSATHTHTATGTVAQTSGDSGEARVGSGFSQLGHSHTYTPTISDESNLPSYRQLRVIQSPVIGEPTEIPAGAIAFFDIADPSGWTRYSSQDGYYVRGENSSSTGGSNTHTHTISGSTGDGSNLQYAPRTSTASQALSSHTHTVSSSIGSINNEPSYVNAYLYKKDATGSAVNGMIAMWNKGAGDSYPSGWEDRSGSGQPFYQKFIKPANGYGSTGGNDSHTHDDVTGITSSQPVGVDTARTSANGGTASGTHQHLVSVTSLNTPNHLPPYIDVAFAERNAIIDVTGNVYNFGTSDALTECDANEGTYELRLRAGGTTYSASCDDATGAFTFVDLVPPSAGDGLVLWIDDAVVSGTDGAMVVRYDGVGDSINNIFYDDAVTISSDDTNPVDILDMNFYDSGDDADIPYTATDDTVDNVSISSGYDLIVKIKSGVVSGSDVFDPNGDVDIVSGDLIVEDNSDAYLDSVEAGDNTNSISGDIIVDTGATLNIDANTTVSGGDITVTGTLAAGTSTVTMAGSGTIGGGGSITFDDLAVNSGVTTTIGSSIAVDGGAFTTTSTGVINYSGTPTVTVDGAGNLGGGSGSVTFYNLTLGDGSGTAITTLATNNLQIDNALVVAANQTFAMGTNSVTVGSTSVSGSGDVTINGSTSQSASGTFTILSNTSDAQLSGSGELDAYNLTIGNSSNTVSVDNETGDLDIDVANNFSITTGATFKASTTAIFTVNGNWSNSGTFTANEGRITMDGTDSNNTMTGTMSGSSAFYNLTFDDGGGQTGQWDLGAINVDVLNDFIITSASEVVSTNGTLSVRGDFSDSGGFSHNGGTVVLNGSADTIQNVTGTSTFNILNASIGDRVITFEASTTVTILNSLTFSGDSCDAYIMIRSSTAGSEFNVTKTGSISLTFADVQDMNVSTTGSTVTNSVDSGNNTNLSFTANTCEGASTNANATGYSFQRKTFFDDINERYWMFYHDGDEIEVKYATDGTDWKAPDTAVSGHLDYDTNDFSVWHYVDTAPNPDVSYVWLAISVPSSAGSNPYDIVVLRGELGSSDVTWANSIYASVALNGSGSTDAYSYPYISLDSNNKLWVGAKHTSDSNKIYKAARSTAVGTNGQTWDATFAWDTAAQLTNDQSASENVFGNIVPLGSGDMYAAFVVDTDVLGCRYDEVTDDKWEDSDGAACTPVAGSGTGDTEGSSTRSTGGAVKIDDEGNPAALSGATRQIVQLSDGTLYSFINDDGNVEAWSSSNGSSWSQQASGTTVTADSGDPVSVSLDSSDNVHVLYISGTVLYYRKFTTSDTPAWGSEETVRTYSVDVHDAYIAVDANDIPHVVAEARGVSFLFEYNNKVGGSWKSSTDAYDLATTITTSPSIIINEDNIPEVTWISPSTTTLKAAVGNQNDASTFTIQNVDTSVSGSDTIAGASIGIDNDGNTWIAYINGTTYLALAWHDDTLAWTTGWTTDISNSANNAGSEPSLSIIGKTIYVFYEETSGDDQIVYDSYDSGMQKWFGETSIASTVSTNYQDVKVRYSNRNFHEPWLMDYLYSDGTDIYWNVLDLRPVNIDDASNFTMIYPNLGRHIVRTTSGTLYSFLNDAGNCEMWKSFDGVTWVEQDSVVTCTNSNTLAMAIDSSDTIHVVYQEYVSSLDLMYNTFNTSTDSFGTSEIVEDGGEDALVDSAILAIDQGNKPHIVYSFDITGTGNSHNYYKNKVSGWSTRVTMNDAVSWVVNISIDIDNKPQVAYILESGSLKAEIGDSNNASSFTETEVDASVSTIGSFISIAVDPLNGNTWIVYKDSGGEIVLAKHVYADSWSTWSTITTKTDIGNYPSIAIAENSQIYVFYQDDSTDQKIVYDVYDSLAGSWLGETILVNPPTGIDYRWVNAKWSFEWNNYGANRIDYLFSDGTDVYWDYLYVRRSPSNIDNASDFGTLPGEGRQVIRTSQGDLYSFINDAGNCEIWKSFDNGNSWSEQNSSSAKTCLSGGEIAMAIDSSDTLHLLYESTATILLYSTFNTSTNTFGGTNDTVHTSSSATLAIAITIDFSDIPHVVFTDNAGVSGTIYYDNKVGGAWNSSDFSIETVGVANQSASITINKDNKPEIVHKTGTTIKAEQGDSNDPSSFTEYSVDTTSVSGISNNVNIGIDSSGNTWIAYIDEDGADDYVTLAWENYSLAGYDDWTTNITNSNVGFKPSMAIDGTNIYVFYEDDQDNIVYDKYNGSSWSGETLLEEHGALQDVKVRWNYINNYDSTGTARVQTNTYYFDASDNSTPGTPTDNDTWTDDTNAFNGSILDSAQTSTTGSSAYLRGEGTNAPATGGTITSVKVRTSASAGGATDQLNAEVNTNGQGEQLGIATKLGAALGWGSYTTLSAPSGGWTWSDIQSLEVDLYLTSSEILPTINSFKTEILVESTNDASPTEIDYLYSDGTDVFYNRLSLGGSTPGSQDPIATATNGVIYNISAVSDAVSPYDVHLIYIDNSSPQQVKYNRWDNAVTPDWQTAITLDNTADTDFKYISLSLDTTTKDLYAVYIDDTGTNDVIYYRQCDVTTSADECSTIGNWVAREAWKTSSSTNYTNVTSNYSGATHIFAQWTDGNASPYNVQWDVIVVPEHLWIFFIFGPILPKLSKKKKWILKKLKGVYKRFLETRAKAILSRALLKNGLSSGIKN